MIVASLTGDPDAGQLASRIAGAKTHFTSGAAILEATVRLSLMLDLDPELVETRVQSLLDEAKISVISINGDIAKKAVAAFATYGKGRGHAAQLSLADCLSYACAQAYRVPLLYTGNGFSQTDIQAA